MEDFDEFGDCKLDWVMSTTIFFSGSGARIASHLGAAIALQDEGIVGDSYGGISGGAIVATFAAMGVLNDVKEEILDSGPGNVFFPPIFNKEGNVRPLMALLGWALHGPRAIASLYPLRIRLRKLSVWDKWKDKSPLYTYVYEKRSGIVRRNSSMYSWAEWIDVLLRGSAIPGVIDAGSISDCGIVRQLPLDEEFCDKAICFVTTQKESSPYLVDDVLRRVALDNVDDEEQILRKKFRKLEVHYLQTKNRTTQYDRDLMRKSYELSFNQLRTNGY